MGVWQLKSFIEEKIDIKSNNLVDVKSAIKESRSGDKNLNPVIVFDAHSLISLLSINRGIENLFGGRLWKCLEYLNKIFSQLKKCNADLVFFFEGSTNEKKIDTWERRQNDLCEKNGRVMQTLNSGATIESVCTSEDARYHLRYNKNLYETIKASCLEFGTVYISENLECDQEIANYVRRGDINVVGIFSNDLDFMIFPGNFRHFSTSDLKFENYLLKTREYPREKLRKELDLDDMQLALFASFCGNDFIHFKELENFHQEVKTKNDTMQYEIANIARKIVDFKIEEITSVEKMDHLVKLFQKDFISLNIISESFKDNLKTSLEFYLKTDLVNSFVTYENNLQYKIENQKVIQSYTPHFFDTANGEGDKICKIYQEQLERKVGVIMHFHPEFKKLKVRSLVKKSHLIKHEIIEVVHNARSLSFESFENFKILKWISCLDSDDLVKFDLQKFPEIMKMNIVTMTILYDQSLITLNELDVLLWTATALHEKLIPRRIELNRNGQVCQRAFSIAHMFINFHSRICECFEILKLTVHPLTFDGVFFHQEYIRLIHHIMDDSYLEKSKRKYLESKFKLIKGFLHKMIITENKSDDTEVQVYEPEVRSWSSLYK